MSGTLATMARATVGGTCAAHQQGFTYLNKAVSVTMQIAILGHAHEPPSRFATLRPDIEHHLTPPKKLTLVGCLPDYVFLFVSSGYMSTCIYRYMC